MPLFSAVQKEFGPDQTRSGHGDLKHFHILGLLKLLEASASYDERL